MTATKATLGPTARSPLAAPSAWEPRRFARKEFISVWRRTSESNTTTPPAATGTACAWREARVRVRTSGLVDPARFQHASMAVGRMAIASKRPPPRLTPMVRRAARALRGGMVPRAKSRSASTRATETEFASMERARALRDMMASRAASALTTCTQSAATSARTTALPSASRCLTPTLDRLASNASLAARRSASLAASRGAMRCQTLSADATPHIVRC